MRKCISVILIFTLVCPVLAQDESPPPTSKDGLETEKLSPEEIARAVEALSSRYVRERGEARRKLIKAGQPAIKPLLEALEAQSPCVRAAAAEILGSIGDGSAVPRLVRLLRDAHLAVRVEARRALIHIGPAAVKYIAEFLKSNPEARYEEFRSVILRMVAGIIASIIAPDGSFGTYPGQFDELKKIGRFAVPALVEIANGRTRSPGWRYLAVSALGCLSDKSAMPALKEIYRGGGLALRDAAALSLAELGDDSCVKELIHEYETKLKQGPQKHIQHSELALIYHKLRDWEKAEAHYQGAIKANPGYGLAYYNYACLLSVKGRTKEALTALKNALEYGYTDAGWLMRDKELDNIRSLPGFNQLIKKHFPQTPDNK